MLLIHGSFSVTFERMCAYRCVSVRGCSGEAAMETTILLSECSSQCSATSPLLPWDYAKSGTDTGRERPGSTFPGNRTWVKLTDGKDADLWCCVTLVCCQRSPSVTWETDSWILLSFILTSDLLPILLSWSLYFGPQPNNSVSGTGLSVKPPTRHSLKQWHRADQIMEGGTALLSQQQFSSND